MAKGPLGEGTLRTLTHRRRFRRRHLRPGLRPGQLGDALAERVPLFAGGAVLVGELGPAELPNAPPHTSSRRCGEPLPPARPYRQPLPGPPRIRFAPAG